MFSNETNLLSSIEQTVKSQQNKLWQLSRHKDLQTTDLDNLDPVYRIKYLDILSKVHFCKEETKQELFSIYRDLDCSIKEGLRLKQIIRSLENQFIQSVKQFNFQQIQQNERNKFDFDDKLIFKQEEQLQHHSSPSYLSNESQFLQSEILQNINKIDISTQTCINETTSISTQSSEESIDQNLVADFFSSELYIDLKNQQFKIDAQLLVIIQTLLINQEKNLFIIQEIQQQIQNLEIRKKKMDQVSRKMLEILIQICH